jgi:serine/threonine-protein kinase
MAAPIPRPEHARAPLSVLSAGGSSSDLVAGDLIGEKYRFESLIAEGGMGIVLRATHVELGSPVAIKVVRPEHVTDEDVVARLLAEAKIVASLRSKHVNRVLDVGRFESGVPYLVLEFLEGSDLAECLAERDHFPQGQAVDYVLQACEGLAEAHANGIVHRDLKPENLFLSEEPDGERVLKILDFGISKAPRTFSGRVLTKPWHMAGSPCYMAPEQMQGADVDGRADVWALGVVLYELCTGRLPFDAPSVSEICHCVLRQEPLPPSWLMDGLDQSLELIIFKCLRKLPEERYQSVVELAEALRPFASEPERVSRVEKVAAATIGRLGSSRTTPRRSNAWSPTTPVALATTSLPGVLLGKRTRRWRAGVMLGVSLVASAALGLLLNVPAWLAPRRSAMPVAAPSATAAAAQPSPPAADPASLVTPPELELLPAVLATPAPKAPRTAAPVRAKAPLPPTAPLVTAVVPVPASSRSKVDAWDRKSFGGRR